MEAAKSMKRVMAIGKTGCGKTTLLQMLNGESVRYHKTQSIQLEGQCIDTPGEYLESKNYFNALQVTAVDADVLLLLLESGDENSLFVPGMSCMFPCELVGIVTKTDIGSPKDAASSRELLELAGATRVFETSTENNKGVAELLEYLSNNSCNN